jgi:hypothetical protein
MTYPDGGESHLGAVQVRPEAMEAPPAAIKAPPTAMEAHLVGVEAHTGLRGSP